MLSLVLTFAPSSTRSLTPSKSPFITLSINSSSLGFDFSSLSFEGFLATDAACKKFSKKVFLQPVISWYNLLNSLLPGFLSG